MIRVAFPPSFIIAKPSCHPLITPPRGNEIVCPKTVAIGAYRNDGVNGSESGHVRVYEYDEADNKWNMLGDDIDGEDEGDFSGWSVSLSSDGKTVAIGADRSDGVHGNDFGHVRVYQLQSV